MRTASASGRDPTSSLDGQSRMKRAKKVAALLQQSPEWLARGEDVNVSALITRPRKPLEFFRFPGLLLLSRKEGRP